MIDCFSNNQHHIMMWMRGSGDRSEGPLKHNLLYSSGDVVARLISFTFGELYQPPLLAPLREARSYPDGFIRIVIDVDFFE